MKLKVLATLNPAVCWPAHCVQVLELPSGELCLIGKKPDSETLEAVKDRIADDEVASVWDRDFLKLALKGPRRELSMSDTTENKDSAEGQEGADYLTGKDGVNSGGPARSEGGEGGGEATKTASNQGATNDDTSGTEEKQAS